MADQEFYQNWLLISCLEFEKSALFSLYFYQYLKSATERMGID
jgi:hypothetical protein